MMIADCCDVAKINRGVAKREDVSWSTKKTMIIKQSTKQLLTDNLPCEAAMLLILWNSYAYVLCCQQ